MTIDMKDGLQLAITQYLKLRESQGLLQWHYPLKGDYLVVRVGKKRLYVLAVGKRLSQGQLEAKATITDTGGTFIHCTSLDQVIRDLNV